MEKLAETVVSFLIDRLISLSTQKAELLSGIDGEVADLKDELESIQSFLNEADARAAAEEYMSEGVKTRVKQLREVAFRIDVVIDEYLLQMAQHHPQRHGLSALLPKPVRFIKMLNPLHEIATKVQEIKASLQKIKERSESYLFQTTDHEGSSSGTRNVKWNEPDPRMASLFLDDAEVVGIESTREKLLGCLVDGSSHRTVISVVGMGGLGKTTLVKKVYDHEKVRERFDCYAWIPVSQSYNMVDLLKSMIEQFCEAKNELPPKKFLKSTDKILLISEARKYLQGKRYVVVFDDVWKNYFWGEIQHALPDNEKGGRIMITTRNLEVANSCKESSLVNVHELEPLPSDEAWKLFCKKAFQSDFGGHCPLVLEKLSRDIVKKCQGLPLGIVAIGGLLSTKDKTVLIWQKLHDSLGF